MYEARFRVADGSGYAAATADTDATAELWCNDHCDLLRVTGEADAPVAYVEDTVGIADAVSEDGETMLITEDCLQSRIEGPVETYLQRHDCLHLPPLRYERGRKVIRVLALDAGALTALYRDMVEDHDVTVERKREVSFPAPSTPLVDAEELLPSLSTRQRQVFLAAIDGGYYEIPRGTTVAAVADEFGLDRRTAEEHLRRAENKLVAAVGELLR